MPAKEDNKNTMKSINIGDTVLNTPIIQGGMGVGVSLSKLATAVANEGGCGTISAVAPGFKEPDFFTNFREANIRALTSEIRKVREKSKGVLAINIMVALTNFNDMVTTAIKENIDIIIAGAGLPLNLPDYRPAGSKTKLVPIVSSDKALSIIIRKWFRTYNCIPDAVVLESPFSGGHQGIKMDDINKADFTLDNQLPKVLSLLEEWEKQTGKKVPVFVAGGVQTGADIKKYVDMGAAGAQIGTRFITTFECDASQEFKNEYIKAKDENRVVVIQSPLGLPLRVLKTKFVESIMNGERKPVNCHYHCLHTCNYKEVNFCIANALLSAQLGHIDEGVCCSGVNGYKNNEVISVAELFKQFREEYANA